MVHACLPSTWEIVGGLGASAQLQRPRHTLSRRGRSPGSGSFTFLFFLLCHSTFEGASYSPGTHLRAPISSAVGLIFQHLKNKFCMYLHVCVCVLTVAHSRRSEDSLGEVVLFSQHVWLRIKCRSSGSGKQPQPGSFLGAGESSQRSRNSIFMELTV